MVSELAACDIADLRSEGFVPTDEDIIRLHALAARITNGAETTPYNAPRHAFAGGFVFWEPTMAAHYWYEYAKKFAADEAMEDWFFSFACVNGRRHGFLYGLRDPKDIEIEVGRFLGSFTGTKAEADRASYFVAVGCDYVRAEKTGIEKKREAEDPTPLEIRNYRELEKILTKAAAATGFTFADLMEQTPSRLRAMIYAAQVQAGMEFSKTSAEAHAQYLATLHAIRERMETERKNGK